MDDDKFNPFDEPLHAVDGLAEERRHGAFDADLGPEHEGHKHGHDEHDHVVEHPGCARLAIPLFFLALLLITMCAIIFKVAGSAIYAH